MIFEGWIHSAHNTPHSLNSAWLTIFWLTVVPYPEELNLKAFPVSSLEYTSFRLTFYTFNSFRDAFPDILAEGILLIWTQTLLLHILSQVFCTAPSNSSKESQFALPHIFVLFRPLVEWVMPNHIGKLDLFISLCIQMLISS